MLYIVGTPIGNLRDLSLRQSETLAKSDIILAEDTRSAQTLLDKGVKELFNLQINPNQRVISYYKEKEFEKLPEVLEYLKEDKEVSLISESGMPLISDPGYLLVKAVIREGFPYTVVPGPSALTTALIHSGFKPDKFIFLGFLPKKKTEIVQLFKHLNTIAKVINGIVFVFYESPARINKTLQFFDKYIPNTQIVIARELTKKFEEILRGKSKDLVNKNYKGEITVVLCPQGDSNP